jgi:hypothetical protein
MHFCISHRSKKTACCYYHAIVLEAGQNKVSAGHLQQNTSWLRPVRFSHRQIEHRNLAKSPN